MPYSTRGRVFTFALALLASGCLDFDQYGEGTGAAGGTSSGGAPLGGAGGGQATCPSDELTPATVCILGAPYLFDGPFSGDWNSTESSTVGDTGCPDSCASLVLGESRLDLRTVMAGVASDCFISIDVLESNAQRTFLELIPDLGTGDPIPPPDRANNIEVAVVGNNVRFEVAAEMIPALTLAEGVVVDRLRIQVRADTVVLEAFAAGEQVACTEQARPDLLLSEPLRAGFGIQGSVGQAAMFDNFGVE